MSNSIFKAAVLEEKREKMGNYTRPNIQRRGLGVLEAIDQTIGNQEQFVNATETTVNLNSYDSIGGGHGDWVNASTGTSTTWTSTISGGTYSGTPNIQLQELASGAYTASTNTSYSIDSTSGDITLTVAGPAFADQVLTATDVLTDTETVTIGSTVYTFQDTLTDTDGNVHVGADLEATLLNLYNAINGTGGTAGVDYAASQTAHPDVEATAVTATTLTIKARVWGTGANSIATTETCADASWGDTTMAGGTTVGSVGTLTITTAANNDTVTIGDVTYTFKTALSTNPTVPYEVLIGASATTAATNLVAAINGTDGSYGSGTVHHPLVRATNASGVVTVTARNAGSAGDAIATTETGAAIAWGGATLASGSGTDNRATLRVTIK